MMIIGIAGGTGSGKTTVVKKIVESLPEGSVAVIRQSAHKSLREQMDLKIFVDAESDERLLRVIERDIAERGHPLEMLIGKYRNILKPMHDEFIEPTKQYADIIIPNGGENARAIRLMKQFIMSALKRVE